MSGYKLASVAGMAAAAVTTVMQYVQDQPGSTQPGTTTKSTQPGSGYQPGTTTRPGTTTTQPGTTTTQPGTPGRDTTGMRGGQDRLFMLQNPDSEQRLNDLAQRLQRMESQMQESSQRIQRQLSQARTLQGDRKTDALADVVQAMVQDHTMMDQYLMDMRMALTGNTSESGAEPRMRRYPSNEPMNPTTPGTGTTPGSPTTIPSTPRTPGTPSTPGSTPSTPGNPGGTPSVPR